MTVNYNILLVQVIRKLSKAQIEDGTPTPTENGEKSASAPAVEGEEAVEVVHEEGKIVVRAYFC